MYMLILQAYVYKDNSGECAAFLVNYDSRDATVLFENLSYKLPPQSISILPNCKNIAFNTAQVTYFCSVAALFFIQIRQSSSHPQVFLCLNRKGSQLIAEC